MNYLRQIKGFYLRRRLFPLSSSAITLYYLLLEQFNLVGFPQFMRIPLSRLMSETNLGKTAVCRARMELVRQKYLDCEKSECRSQSARYSIITIDPDEYLNKPERYEATPAGLLPKASGGAK